MPRCPVPSKDRNPGSTTEASSKGERRLSGRDRRCGADQRTLHCGDSCGKKEAEAGDCQLYRLVEDTLDWQQRIISSRIQRLRLAVAQHLALWDPELEAQPRTELFVYLTEKLRFVGVNQAQ